MRVVCDEGHRPQSLLEAVQFMPQRPAHRQQRRCNDLQSRMACDKLLDASLEMNRRRLADLQAETAQNAAQARFGFQELLLHQLARSQHGARSWASIDLQCTGRYQ